MKEKMLIGPETPEKYGYRSETKPGLEGKGKGKGKGKKRGENKEQSTGRAGFVETS
jgi:hypothetical protein